MKQTVEEAAHSFAESRSSGSAFPAYYQGFIAGAEWQKDISSAKWQSKQSPWISVKDKAGCDTSGDCIVMVVDGDIFKAYFSSENKWMKSNGGYYDEVIDDVVAWIPIPSFDEILKANKDILERLK